MTSCHVVRPRLTNSRTSFLLLICARLGLVANGALYSDGTCPVLTLLPFSAVNSPGPPEVNRELRWVPANVGFMSYSWLASAVLAMDHFNERNSMIVPELATIAASNCTARFPGDEYHVVADTEMSAFTAVRDIWIKTRTLTQGPQNTSKFIFNEHDGMPCAVLGPMIDGVSVAVESITQAMKVVQMCFYDESDRADRPDNEFKFSVGNAPWARMGAMLQYLQQPPLRREYLSIISGESPTEKIMARTAESTGPIYDIAVSTFSEESHQLNVSRRELIRTMVKNARDTGVKTILLDIEWPDDLLVFADELQNRSMLSNDYLYLLSSDLIQTNRDLMVYANQTADSPMDKLLSGALVLIRLDPFRVTGHDDPFYKAWESQNSSFVERVNSLYPLNNESKYYFSGAADFFQTNDPGYFSSYVYDAVMAVGIGACNVSAALDDSSQGQQQFPSDPNLSGQPPAPGQQPPPYQQLQQVGENTSDQYNSSMPPVFQQVPVSSWNSDSFTRVNSSDTGFDSSMTGDDGSNGTLSGSNRTGNNAPQSGATPPPDTLPPFTDTLSADIQRESFQGASGQVNFPSGSRLRSNDTVPFGMFNIRSIVAPDQNTHSYELVLTATWTEKGRWVPIPGVQNVYRNGSTVPPIGTRDVVNANYLSNAVRSIGFCLFALCWLITITFIVLLHQLRKDATIQRAQPFFLHLLCAGTLILSASIVTLSWDENAGASDRQLDFACMSTPWLFFLGHVLTFAALATKLRRADKVLQFRRRAVTVRAVMGPLVALMTTTVVILILWTVLDPWTWHRITVQEVPYETYGECYNNHFWAFFGPLMALLVFSEGVTAFLAWKTADVPEDFRESNTVMYAVCTHLQAWIVGVPILAVLGNSSADATYFGRVLLIWIFSMSSVVVVVGTKVYRAIRVRRNPTLRVSQRVSVRGLYAGGSRDTPNTSFIHDSTSFLGGNDVKRERAPTS